MKPWRLLDSGAAPGSYNLALDEALFRLARQGRSPLTGISALTHSQTGIRMASLARSCPKLLDDSFLPKKGFNLRERLEDFVVEGVDFQCLGALDLGLAQRCSDSHYW